MALSFFEYYDNVAAYWFILTIVGLVVVPRGIYLVFTWLFSKAFGWVKEEDPCFSCKCADCNKKCALLRERQRKTSSMFSCWNILWFVFLIVFVLMVVNMGQFQTKQLSFFNPYDTLGIDVGSSSGEIKKAYRQLSLKYHPDKNPGNEEAARQFILVAKAYKTLTDEATRENWEKYGTPDGYQGVSVTIGLPSFLVDKENEKTVLMIYFLCLVFLPIIVFAWWKNAQFNHESGVHGLTHDIYQFYFHPRNPHHLSTEGLNAPLFLERFVGCAADFWDFTTEMNRSFTGEKRRAMVALMKRVATRAKEPTTLIKDDFDTKNPPNWAYPIRRPAWAVGPALLRAHLLGVDVPAELQSDMEKMLEKMPILMDFLIQLVFDRTRSIDATAEAIRLAQHIYQKLPLSEDNPLHQLSIPPAVSAVLSRSFHSFRNVAPQIVQLTEKERKLIESFDLGKFEKMCAKMPQLAADCLRAEVKDETCIREGDVVTIYVSVSRDGETKQMVEHKQASKHDPLQLEWNNWNHQQQASTERVAAHCPRYPFLKHEVFYLALVDEKAPIGDGRRRGDKQKHRQKIPEAPVMIHFQKLLRLDPNEPIPISFKLPDKHCAGQRPYQLHLFCDSYIHGHVMVPFLLDVKPEYEEKEEVFADEDAAVNVNEVIPRFMWLSSYHFAFDIDWLLQTRITHMISLSAEVPPIHEGLPPEKRNSFHYFRLGLVDHPNQTIPFTQISDFIADARKANGKVLIHSVHGNSRAASAVLHYLMLTDDMKQKKNDQCSLKLAMSYLQHKANDVNPNDGFIRQLIVEERRIFGEQTLFSLEFRIAMWIRKLSELQRKFGKKIEKRLETAIKTAESALEEETTKDVDLSGAIDVLMATPLQEDRTISELLGFKNKFIDLVQQTMPQEERLLILQHLQFLPQLLPILKKACEGVLKQMQQQRGPDGDAELKQLIHRLDSQEDFAESLKALLPLLEPCSEPVFVVESEEVKEEQDEDEDEDAEDEPPSMTELFNPTKTVYPEDVLFQLLHFFDRKLPEETPWFESNLWSTILYIVMSPIIFNFFFMLYRRGAFHHVEEFWQQFGQPLFDAYVYPLWQQFGSPILQAINRFVATYLFDMNQGSGPMQGDTTTGLFPDSDSYAHSDL